MTSARTSTSSRSPRSISSAPKRRARRSSTPSATFDDDLAEAYLENGDVEIAQLKAAIRKAVLELGITPVFCGSAFKNKGVQPLLDAVVDYLPSPLDVPPVEGIVEARNGDITEEVRNASDDEPFAALAFKIAADPFVGKLTYFRVYSGRLSAGSRILNVSSGKTERVGRILMMHANDREELEEVYAGDIAAAVGIKQIVTGDTLCAPDAPIKLENIVFPEPVIKVAVEPKTKSDQEKMSVALGRLAEEDPTFQVQTNEETGQIEISGMGELHLEVLVDRMRREFNVEANVGKPQVSYRETIRGEAKKIEGKFVRQTGGSGQYGVVYIDMEPAPGEGFDFVSKIKGGSVPTEFIPAIEKGVEEAMETGVKAGYPMVDIRVTLVDGKYHDTDSSEIAFKVAGSLAFKEAATPGQARPARADLRGRGRHPGGVPGRRHRRPEQAARSRRGPGSSRQRARGHRPRPAVGDVRLRDGPAFQHPGPGHLHDAVRQLRRGSAEHRGEDRRRPQRERRGSLSTPSGRHHDGSR